MRLFTLMIAGLGLLLGVSQANAESRTVFIQARQDKDQKAAVTIYSDEKKEQQSAISVDDAVKVIVEMRGWGSMVGVYVTSDRSLRGAQLKKLLAAITENDQLDLVYFGREVPKAVGDHFQVAPDPKRPAREDENKPMAKPGSSPQQPLSVSLLQLIATPDAFDGKYVRVQGFVRIEPEGTAIYLHREDAEYMLTKNGLWLAANDATPDGSKEAQVKDRYALIEGRFTATKKGHMGLWSGSVEDITRMEPWEIRKAKK